MANAELIIALISCVAAVMSMILAALPYIGPRKKLNPPPQNPNSPQGGPGGGHRVLTATDFGVASSEAPHHAVSGAPCNVGNYKGDALPGHRLRMRGFVLHAIEWLAGIPIRDLTLA